MLGPDRQRSSVNVAGARASNRVVFRALASPPRTRSGGIAMVPARAFFSLVGVSSDGNKEKLLPLNRTPQPFLSFYAEMRSRRGGDALPG